jgi:hypothetical protein
VVLPDRFSLIIPERKVKVYEFSHIKEIALRTVCHHPTAIEIFVADSTTLFLNFKNVNSVGILNTLKGLAPKVQTVDFRTYFRSTSYLKDWKHRRISNFEYLLLLNKHSGRTINSLEQYPVMPWVLQDYTSETLDFKNPEIYRDLSKPLGALSESRLHLLTQLRKGLDGAPLYDNGYSSFMVCTSFMIRVEPFTTMHIDLQKGHFDCPTRLFNS